MKKRNSDFKGTSVILPDPLSPYCQPIAGFKHLRPEHNILLPKVTLDQVEAYYFTLYMQGRIQGGGGGAHPAPPPPLKLEKIRFFGVKS